MDSRTALEILAHTDRQHIITELLENGGQSDVGVLAELLAVRRENNADETDRERATLELHHNHLPKLADHDVVRYDQRNGDVVLEDATELIPYLNTLSKKRSIPLEP